MRRGVISVDVERAAGGGTRASGKAPANRSVWMASAADCYAKRLCGAQFDAGSAGREGQRDVTDNGEKGGGGFGCVAIAGGGDLYY